MSDRSYEIVVTVRHHDDSGGLGVTCSMRYQDEPHHLLLDADDSDGRSRGQVREATVNMVRACLRVAM